ncbi:MAG: hypothetical protein NT023_01740 [Armatimonadetes bacterium]|nr:hypothetical protein [Armatimonadota bacterium]
MMYSKLRLLTPLFVLFALSYTCAFAQQPPLKNGGFEGGGGTDGKGGGVPYWSPYESGYDVDRVVFHSGEQAIRCDVSRIEKKRGASVVILLDQKQPLPIVITAWSRADSVSGVRDGDYSLYIDIIYQDGTPQWGQFAPFNTGTHDWEKRQLLIHPQKPVKQMSVYALFRNHVGTAWFDDFYVRELKGENLFDSQTLAYTGTSRTGVKVAGKATAKDGMALSFSATGSVVGVTSGGRELAGAKVGGFYVRDALKEGEMVPFQGSVKPIAGGGVELNGVFADTRLMLNAKITPDKDTLSIDAQVTDTGKTERAITLYFALPVDAAGWSWGQDMRVAQRIEAEGEYTNQVVTNVGSIGSISLYPYSCVSNGQSGVSIVNQMDWPSVFRLFYNGAQRQSVIAWDFALTSKSATWPPNRARARCTVFGLPSALAGWGFRAATQRFYQLYSAFFTRRTKHEGIWMPFTNPAIVQNREDFGFAFHEGSNSVKSDDALNILSFRYTEPSSYWLPMPPDMPRTYENAMKLIEKNAQEGKGEAKDFARAVLNSGTMDANGRYNLEFQNQPWANGAVFMLNPNPELASGEDQPTKGSLSYSFLLANKLYDPKKTATDGELDGEYLDSLESWMDTLDYRPAHILTCPFPLTFSTETRTPVLPQWYSLYSFARYVRDDLQNRGKLFMANTTPVRFTIFAQLFDLMGIEVNWLPSATWQPDSDAAMSLRRTMSGQKPYLLLMNTDFNRFTLEHVEKYFQTCLFYAMYPSMFSVDAASNPYWDNPKWYNRDRPLFKKYLPLIQKLSSAGWEAITYATSDNPSVGVERYGKRYLTLRNLTAQPQTAEITLSSKLAEFAAGRVKGFRSLVDGKEFSGGILKVTLKVDEVLAVELMP